jgi:integrase
MSLTERLVDIGLAPSTRKRYRVGIRALWRFAGDIGWIPELPVSEAILCLFVASKAGEIRASTMKGYLCAVHSWHVDEGVPVNFSHFRRLKRTLRGMENLEEGTPVKRAAPITMAAVARMATVANLEDKDEVTLMAIAALATAGLFRLGELVPYKYRDEPVLVARRVWVTDEGVWVHLPKSKTDQCGKLPPMLIARNDGLACPRLWIMKMRAMRNWRRDQPTFVGSRGRPVTREWVLKRVNAMMARAGLGEHSYSGHSFRRGGTTSLAAAGVPDHIIARLGRWRSATYQIYVAASPDRLAAAQREMAASPCVFGVVGMSSRPAGARHA